MKAWKRTNGVAAGGFTLIEVMVTIGIIVILAAIVFAVAANVKQNAQMRQTQVLLRALEGMITDYNLKVGSMEMLAGTDGVHVIGTVYVKNGGKEVDANPTKTSMGDTGTHIKYNYINILYRNPETKEQLVKLAGSKLSDNEGYMVVRDAWGTPVHFIARNWKPGGSHDAVKFSSDWLPDTTRMYLRSSGPDRQTNFTKKDDVVNNDDILSYEPTK